MRIVIPKSADGCTYTITTRHQTTAPTNLIGGGIIRSVQSCT